ncbi:MAG TPA: Spy/CpxP family protein refolding chaperone [Bryobacteraceae bacterium]|nr:Spy/CpxP family protein refolding chaperone [Bryobacteraceae bacterium]
MKSYFRTTMVLALMLLPGAVWAQTAAPLQPGRNHRLAQRLAIALDLSADQKAGIQAILEKERPSIAALLQQMRQQNLQLRSKTTFDEAFVRSVAQQRAATASELMVEKEKIRTQILALLTPAQQEKLKQMRDVFQSRMQERMGQLSGGM